MPSVSSLTRLLRSLLLEDWWLKIICFCLAVLMWFYIDGELTDHRDFIVSLRPVDVEIPAGWELSTEAPLPKFSMRLRGPRRRLQFFSADNITIRKQTIPNPQPGRNPINIVPTDAEAEGFEILSVAPRDEKGGAVTLLSTARRMKRVRVKIAGRANSKFVAEPPVVDPDQVNIEGPSEDLDQIEFVSTEDLDITDAEQDIVREIAIVPYFDTSSGRRIIFRCNSSVRVTVKIHPEQVTRKMTLDVRPLTLSGTALTVEPKSVDVEVQAEEQEFAAPDFASSILLFVEWPRAWEMPKDAATILGPLTVQVRAAPPPRVQIRGVNGAALPTVKVRGSLAPALAK